MIENERIEQEYTSKLDSLSSLVKKNATISKKINHTTLSFISKDRQLEKERKKCEVEIESLNENIQSHFRKFLAFFSLKTCQFIYMIFYNYNTIYSKSKALI